VKQRRDMIPKRVRGTVWRGFVFDLGACMCQSIKCSGRGSWCGSSEPVRGSSEAESRPRGRPALERGGVHPRGRPTLKRGGVSLVQRCVPRAKRSFARGWQGLTVLMGR
jgi:hypothetical protein